MQAILYTARQLTAKNNGFVGRSNMAVTEDERKSDNFALTM